MSFLCISCGSVFSFGCVGWKSRHVGQFLIVLFMSAFKVIQFMDSCASSLVFSMLMWLMCGWSNTFFCNDAGIIIFLPFLAIPPMTAISCLKDQYGCTSFWTSAFVDGYHIIHILISHIYAHLLGMVVMFHLLASIQGCLYVSIVFMLMLILVTSSSLFSLRLCLDSQSTINSCGPGMNRILVLSLIYS